MKYKEDEPIFQVMHGPNISRTLISNLIPPAPMSPIPVMQPVPEVTETGAGKRAGSRRASNVSTGRRSRLGSESAGVGVGLEGGAGNERVQVNIHRELSSFSQIQNFR